MLERAIPAALDVLAVGGRIVVLAYQSLEDRIVKRVLAGGVQLDRPARPARRAARAPPASSGCWCAAPSWRATTSRPRTRARRRCACAPPSG